MNKQQLANKIWESANRMRSKIEANEYKDYILGFIFYKFLSDKEVDRLKKDGYGEDDIREYVHENNPEVVAYCQQELGYFIAYDNLFSTWLAKGNSFTVDNVRTALSAFNRLISETQKKVFSKIFNTLETGLSKLGDSTSSQTKSISELIQLIKDIPTDGKQDYDVLGFIYEYLISNFAANAGKKAGEFYTPHEVSQLMSEIVAHHLKDREKIEIYDPTSGSGSLLITIGKSVAKYTKSKDDIMYYAQELKENTYNLTRMNLVMRGIKPDNIFTRCGDTLEQDWPMYDDVTQEYNPLYLDAVVSNPPYSQRWDPKHKDTDPRYRYGIAPKGKADYAFLLHDLYHLKPEGIMTIVLPHGVLFRGDALGGPDGQGEGEGKIRRNLIENNNIEAIIGLPANIFFGTGIPTSDVFGNELHRYSIADGIRDKNVLGFDPYMVPTYKDRDLRKAVALEKAKAPTEAAAMSDPKKKKAYLHYMDHTSVPMAGVVQADGTYLKGIEDYLPNSQYEREEHQRAVVTDILDNWVTLSHGSKFHAIFATSSIPEAIQYYRLFKEIGSLKVTALFDPSIDNNGGAIFKEESLIEILEDYNARYDMKFKLATYGTFKKDVSYRLAHKEQYKSVERTPDQQIDLLIVVDQMLTGFDSKWINTLYLDKVLVYEKLIQAFSRTNRLFGPEKPFGTIRYYRKPYTMRRNIDEAFKLYSGDKPLGLFADKLEYNLGKLNELYDEIEAIFRSAGVGNFEKLPEDHTERGQFAKLFKRFNNYLEAAKIQGFTWNKLSCEIKTETGKTTVELHLDETTYLILALRYKELFSGVGTGLGGDDVPYEIDSYLTEINTGVIDANYMNSRFTKYLKALQDGTETAAVLDELHKSFATLTQEEQKYANIFLHDVQNGDVVVDEGKTLRDYITEYMTSAKNDQIHRFAKALGADETMLRDFMQLRVTEANINEFGRFDKLKATVNRDSAKVFLETLEGAAIKPFQINMKVDRILRKFILEGGFDIA